MPEPQEVPALTPSASVIVPSYRGEARLPVLLGGLARQDTTDFEVVVVIDGEVDASAAVLADLGESTGLDLDVIVFPSNRGRVAALNAGHAAARGEVLIRCDDDLLPEPDFVSGHVARHAHHGPRGVVALANDVMPDSPYARAYGVRSMDHLIASAYAGDIEPWRLWSANCSLTRGTWEQVGEYSQEYAHYGMEDTDYGYRLHQAGIPLVIAPELQVAHLGAPTSTHDRVMRAFHSGASRRTFEARHGSALSLPSAGTGPWGRLVDGLSRAGDESRYERATRAVDRLLPYVPRYVAEKLVALCVESASLAGYRHAQDVTASF